MDSILSSKKKKDVQWRMLCGIVQIKNRCCCRIFGPLLTAAALCYRKRMDFPTVNISVNIYVEETEPETSVYLYFG